jgi:chromosome segregation ATPase
MGSALRLRDFCQYVADRRQSAHAVYTEIEEVQRQFNGIYGQTMEAWKTNVSKGAPLLLAPGAALPPSLAQTLLNTIAEERAKLEKEMADLTAKVKSLRAEGDSAVHEAQAELEAMRRENPELDAREERTKAHLVELRQQVARIHDDLKRTSLLAFGQRNRLNKELAETQRGIAAEESCLHRVRQEWVDEKQRFQQNQTRLHAKWDTAAIEAAQSQARLDYLQSNLETLSRQNGAGRTLAELQAEPEGTAEPLRAVLAQMVGLNRTKTDYEAGLRTVAEALGLLKGLADGLDRFQLSANKVLEEQQQYSLKELRIELGPQVTDFHAVWPEFQAQVKDEKTLGTHPAEFSKRVEAILAGRFTDAAIAAMFDGMGTALDAATKVWH